MGKDFKNIDELIKSGLQGFETEAPPDAWDAIAGEIGQKDRKLTPVFWRWAAAIAILIGLTVVLKTQFINPDRPQITKIENRKNSNQSISNEKEKQEIDRNIRPLLNNNEINPKDKSGNKSEIPPRPPETKAAVGNEKLLANSSGDQGKNIPEKNIQDKENSDNILIADVERKNEASEIKHSENIENKDLPVISETKKSVVIADNSQDQKNDRQEIPVNDQKIIELPKDLLADNSSKSNWSVGGGVSPVYSFRNLNNKTDDISYDWAGGQNNEKNESPIVAFSGGLDVEYNSNRWSFSSGLYYSQSGQETNNFNFNRMIVSNTGTNIYASTSAGNIAYQQVSTRIIEHFNIGDDGPYSPNIFETEPIESDATLKQDFEYLEIPFITKFKIVDRKIDIQILAGVSTSFLIGNTNILSYSNNTLDMGEIKNLRNINYNSLVGLGFQYPFTKSLKFRLQPMFKYALRSLNEDYAVDNFPYSFAVYSGFAFDF